MFCLVVTFIASVPLSANASFFSDLFGGGQAQASAEQTTASNDDSNLQNVDVLATNSSDPDLKNANNTDDSLRIGWDGSYIESSGTQNPLGIPVEKSSISDQIVVYTVEEGDTLSEIADSFGVSVNTIRWENNLSGQTISVGQKLNILPMTGVKHIVKKGDTISKIADRYEADPEDIYIFNDISKGDALKQGDIIFVPNGIIKPVIPTKPTYTPGKILVSNTKVDSGYYIRPVAGLVTSPYGPRHRGFHPGVDIGNSRGTPVAAAASGVVVASVNGCVERKKNCGGGYGNHIDIEHPNGTMTRYGHLTRSEVVVGQSVTQGEEIGLLGSTGNSTGPHLHFEIRNSSGSTMRPPVY